MYGFKDKRLISSPRLTAYILSIGFIALLYLLMQLKLVALENGQIITIGIALVGWVIALDILFLQINTSLRYQLQSRAIDEIQMSMTGLADAFSPVVTFSNDFVVKPMEIPNGFWFDQAQKKFNTVSQTGLTMREAFGGFYRALESNEMAIIPLEHYYRFMTIKIGDYIDRVDEANTAFLHATSDYYLTEEGYKKAVVDSFKGLHDEWAAIAAYSMDFRKIIQNSLLGDVFKRTLLHRVPKPGYGTTLDVDATREKVLAMVNERDGKYVDTELQDDRSE